MTETKSTNKLLYYLPIIWFVINLVQGYFTEISKDEAYYWVYAQKLDWGYFDHPPMIALMIKAGYSIIPNILGVRLFTIVMSSLTLFFLFLINNKKQPLLMFLIFASISIFQTYSFIAVPDSPMLFFTVLLLFLLQSYIKEDSIKTAISMGVVVALLLYSKYHGILIVLMIVLSSLQFFKRKSFYLIILVSLLVYIPHVYWQVIYDYPSFKFHVLNKSHDPYNPMDSLSFVLGQIVVFGPLIGFIFFKYLYKNKVKNQFEKTLKILVIGFICFFFLSTLNSHGELNWTGVAVVPAIILFHRWLNEEPSRFVKPVAYISIGLFFIVRIHLMHSLLSAEMNNKSEFHNGKSWATAIHDIAGDLPVVFKNSYQDASKYAFYTGQVSHSLNNSRYRKNQYDLWDIEDSLQGKKVMVIHNWFNTENDSLITSRGKQSIGIDSNFYSYTKVEIDIDSKKIIGNPEEIIPLEINIHNGYEKTLFFDQGEGEVDLIYEIYYNGKIMYTAKIQSIKDFVLSEDIRIPITVLAPEEKGKYYLKFNIKTKEYGPFINSRFVPFIVE